MKIDCTDIKDGLIIEIGNHKDIKYNLMNCDAMFWDLLEKSGAETGGEVADTSYYIGFDFGFKSAVEYILKNPDLLK